MSGQFVDATGVPFELDGPVPSRVVSLVPSLTETLFALGVGGRLSGVTRFCSEPAELVAPLPKVGGTKDPAIDAILALQPDLVIASSEENREEDIVTLRRAGIPVFVTHYPSVDSAIDGISMLGVLLHVDVRECAWLNDARQTALAYARGPRSTIPYFCPIWRRPYMVARRDTYMADLLALAGGRNAFAADAAAHYYTIDLARLAVAAPAVILLPDEPYRFRQRHIADFQPYAAVPAVRDGCIHLIDGKALTWYGPRTAGALLSLHGLVHSGQTAGVSAGATARSSEGDLGLTTVTEHGATGSGQSP